MPRRGMIMVSPTQSVPQVLAVWGSNKKEASSVPEVRDYGSIKKSNPNISTKIHSFTFKNAGPTKTAYFRSIKRNKNASDNQRLPPMRKNILSAQFCPKALWETDGRYDVICTGYCDNP